VKEKDDPANNTKRAPLQAERNFLNSAWILLTKLFSNAFKKSVDRLVFRAYAVGS
jgi:hypothetical protein